MKMVAAAKLRGEQNRLAAAKNFAAWTSVLGDAGTQHRALALRRREFMLELLVLGDTGTQLLALALRRLELALELLVLDGRCALRAWHRVRSGASSNLCDADARSSLRFQDTVESALVTA